ncbi:flagellar biosynthesis protein [Aliiroseovarius marinus]|uniref:flagellar biosynthesis protein n=1 Tax=Aliiroseovarius marinus TaxID=2500159 RepID=UPI003D7E7C23
MSARLTLEDFGTTPAEPQQTELGQPVQSIDPAELEGKRLEGYEAGYKAGWDDATRSMTQEAERVEAEFARNLEDLGFTFQEARSHVLSSLEPLLNAMVNVVLPNVVQDAIAQVVAEEIVPMAATAADNPIQVLVAPGIRGALEQLLESSTNVPFELIEQATLPEGQIYLRSPVSEKQIDMSGVLDRMRDAVGALYDINEKAFNHG